DGLIHVEIFGFLDQTISRHDIAGTQEDDISENKFFDRDFQDALVTKHARFDSYNGKESLHGIACAAFLPKPEQPADKDNGKNNESIRCVAQEERQPRREEENQRQRALELCKQQRERIRTFLGFKEIQT